MNEKTHPSPANAKQQSATPSTTQSAARDEAHDRGGAVEDARAIGSQAAGLASDVASQVAHSAERQFAGGKDRAADAISEIAGALRQTGKQLLAKEMPVANDYLGR